MSINKRAVLFSGGTIEAGFALAIIRKKPDCCLIGIDGGAEFLYRYQIEPDYVIGDFDSLSKEAAEFFENEKKTTILKYLPEKDVTDTELGINLAIELGYDKITLLGATGSRIDHVWANIQTLLMARKKGADVEMLDPHNRIRVRDESCCLRQKDAYGPFFSVFSLNGPVEHFSIKGAKYPLTNYTLDAAGSLCVSNEFEEDVWITFPKGNIIIMETRDEEETR